MNSVKVVVCSFPKKKASERPSGRESEKSKTASFSRFSRVHECAIRVFSSLLLVISYF